MATPGLRSGSVRRTVHAREAWQDLSESCRHAGLKYRTASMEGSYCRVADSYGDVGHNQKKSLGQESIAGSF